MTAALPRRLLAEFLGSALLVAAVVGSGIMAAQRSPGDVGLQLLENSIATVLALAVLILVLGPVSGAHLNPVVTAVDWWLHRGRIVDAGAYVGVQIAGGIAGSVLANSMFAVTPISWSTTSRNAPHLWTGEVVATAGLVLLIFAFVRTHRTTLVPAAVGAYIGAAYWFTSSTSFANPAVTIGRAFTDSFAGISPTSVPAFVAAQLAGAALGLLTLILLYPKPTPVTADTAAVEPANE